MPHFTKEEVTKAILGQIKELCAQKMINYNGISKRIIVDKSFCFKEIREPVLFLDKKSYPIGNEVLFEGNGIFVFVSSEDSRFESPDFKFSGTAKLSSNDEGECVVTIVKNILTISTK